MEKAYVANLKFDIIQRQIWFVAEDNNEMNEKWKTACIKLNEIGDKCTEPTEFFSSAIKHFEGHGFIHVVK